MFRKRKREESRKYVRDSLTAIAKQLASHPSASTSSSSYWPPLPPKANRDNDIPSEVQVRLSREATERGHALELIRRKKREMEGNVNPSTVFNDSGYGNIYNKRGVREAHWFRDKRWDSVVIGMMAIDIRDALQSRGVIAFWACGYLYIVCFLICTHRPLALMYDIVLDTPWSMIWLDTSHCLVCVSDNHLISICWSTVCEKFGNSEALWFWLWFLQICDVQAILREHLTAKNGLGILSSV